MRKRYSVQEKARFWRVPELENLEILHATYVTHSFVPHSHASFVTSVIDSGVGALWYRGRTHIAPAGSLVLLNPGEIHTGQVVGEDGWSYRALYPGTDLLSHIADEIAQRSWHTYLTPTPIIYDTELTTLMHRLHTSLAEDATMLERESWLLHLYSRLLTRYAERPPALHPIYKERQAVKRAREYIEAHYDQNILLSDLALVSGLTPFHLVRVFHDALGLPPHAYLNQVRLLQAKQCLLEGHSITTVAYETGFSDQSHLTKRFKRTFGITPGQLLQQSKS